MNIKQIKGYIKIQIKAQQANPSPPIGPALGQYRVNIMEFCKEFNKKTQNIEKGTPVPVVITVYEDKNFSFIIKNPTVSFLIKKTLNIKSGSGNPKKEYMGTITVKQIEDIVKIKNKDLTASNIDAAIKTIAGSARSMGLKVQGNEKND